MKTLKKKDEGSAILSVLMFAVIILGIIAAAGRSVVNDYDLTNRSVASEKSFHVAESGIERAIYALQNDNFPGGEWVTDESGVRVLAFDIEAGGKSSSCVVEIRLVGTDLYKILATGTTVYGGKSVSRMVCVMAEIQQSEGNMWNYCQSDFIFKERIFFRPSNRIPFQAGSWNSKESVDPIFEPDADANVGYDILIASLLDEPDAIQLNNAWINGYVAVAGTQMPLYNTEEQYSNPNQEKLRARLKGPSTPDDVSFDTDRVIQNFEYEFVTPVRPDPNDYHVQLEFSQNAWSGQSEVVLGELNKRTHVLVHNGFSASNLTINVQGDVFVFVDGPVNANGIILFRINGESSRFTLMAAGNINFGNNLAIESRYPHQFLILQPENHGHIMVHTKRFSGYIYAPESAIALHGSANSQDYPSNLFLGGIVGKNFDHTNSFILVSDESMNNTVSTPFEEGVKVVVIQDWREVADDE